MKKTKKIMHRPSLFIKGVIFLLSLGIVFLLASQAASSTAQITKNSGSDQGLKYLEKEVSRLSTLAKGMVGVAAVHLDTGRTMYLNRDVAFPMASTYKVPIAVEILSKIDAGELRLDKLITAEESDVYRTYGTISDLLDNPGVILSVRNLLDLMLQMSDNNATDIMLRIAGGPKAVTARMKEIGAEGIRVDRPTWGIISAFVGHPEITWENPVLPPQYLQYLESYASKATEDDHTGWTQAFNKDPRDTASPKAMATLLTKIWRKEILSLESSEILLDIMYECKTGEDRIKGLLPPGTRVAHKTGTIGESTNDVGIIELPDGAGHVVTVVFVKESKLRGTEEMGKVIAQISRAIHDYFIFNRQ